MDISPTSSALNLINGAQHKSAEAAHKIATLPVKNEEVGSIEYKGENIIKPILSLKEAELETSAAVKILETEKKTIGSILDIKA